MSTLLTIKRRITSVSSTKQITKAMQLVAASKLRKAEQVAHGPQKYIAQAESAVRQLCQGEEAQTHPLTHPRPLEHAMTVIVAGDHGMAGAYNGNILRSLGVHAEQLGVSNSVICIGHRVAPSVDAYPPALLHAVYDTDTHEAVEELAHPVTSEIMHLFADKTVDRVDLIYTAFTSTAKQTVVTKQLLPLELPPSDNPLAASTTESRNALSAAAERLIEATILEAILQSRASEQAARMVSMMNATNNAKDLIDDLTLSYHEARQSAITQELAEISTAAEAMSGGVHG